MTSLINKFFKWFEPGFAILSLFHYSQALTPLLLTGGANEGDGQDILAFNYFPNVLIFLVIYIVTAVLLLLRWKKVITLLRHDGWIVLLVGLAAFSVLWSSDPSNTVSASIGLLGTTMFGLYLATRYSIKEQLQLLACMYGISIILSLLFAIALPKYGLMAGVHEGALRGIYTHKNVLGKTMSLAGIVFILLAGTNRSYKFLSGLGLATLFVLPLLARSSTGLAISCVLLFAWFVYRSLKWRYERMLPLALFTLLFVVGGFMLISQTFDLLLGLVGRDATLTGRTEFWPQVIHMIERKPWLGYGFNAFWNGLRGESAYIIRTTRWPINDPHSGFLELWLALGAVGVSTFLFGYWATIVRAATYARQSIDTSGLFPLLYLTYLLLVNLTETTLLSQNTLTWVLYTAVAFSVVLLPQSSKEITTIPQSSLDLVQR